MTITKKIISYIIAAIMAICIISIILLSCASHSLLSKNNLKAAFDENDYYYNVYDIILDSCKSDIMPSGFDEKVLNNVITESKVHEEINKLVDSLYDNKKVELSTEEMKKTLHQNVEAQIQEGNHEVNKETQENIKEFENSIINIYKNNISYSENTINQIRGYLNKVIIAVKIAIIVLAIITAVLMVLLFFINKSAIGISFVVSGAFFIIMKFYSGTTVAINNILILNWAFSKVLSYILNQLVQNMFTIGIILTVVGVLIVLINEFISAKKAVQK